MLAYSLSNSFLDFRLRSGRTTDEGRIERYINGIWSPICLDQHKQLNTITEYCQGMGYADGIEIPVERHPAEKNITKCSDGKDLHIRCYAQSKKLIDGYSKED